MALSEVAAHFRPRFPRTLVSEISGSSVNRLQEGRGLTAPALFMPPGLPSFLEGVF